MSGQTRFSQRRHAAIPTLLAALLLGACSTSATDTGASDMRKSTPPTTGVSAGSQAPASAGDVLPGTLVDRMRADYAKRLGVDADTVRLVEAAAVNWPDASLGCPEPGMAYAQVITPGYRAVLEAPHAKPQTYHASARGQFMHCRRPAAVKPRPRQSEL